MKRPLLIASGVAAVLALSLSGCASSTPTSYSPTLDPQVESYSLVEENTLTVGIDFNDAPYSIQSDGELVGLDVSVAKAVAEEMGLKVSFVDVSGSPEIALSDGTVDVVMSTEPSAYDTTIVTVVGSYVQEGPAIFGKSSSDFDKSMLNGANVGVQASSVSESLMKENYSKATLIEYESAADAFDALENGEVDYVVTDTVSGSYLSANHDSIYYITSLDEAELVSQGIAVSSSNPEVANALAKALETIESNGVLKAAAYPWLGSYINLYEPNAEIVGDLLVVDSDGATDAEATEEDSNASDDSSKDSDQTEDTEKSE